MKISILYGWVTDHINKVSYKQVNDAYVRRDANGQIETIQSLPTFITEYLLKHTPTKAA